MAKEYRGPAPVNELIWIPCIITLAVTVLRLVGELAGGPPILFGTTAGGGATENGFPSLVGISWLIPIFGIYFGYRLSKLGFSPQSLGDAVLRPILALVVFMGSAIGGFAVFGQTSPFALLAVVVGSVVGIWIVMSGWLALARTLLWYTVWARTPVVAIMFFALAGKWGTHYDALPAGSPDYGWFASWILYGVLPQYTIWIAFTMIVGGLLGGLVGFAVRGSRGR